MDYMDFDIALTKKENEKFKEYKKKIGYTKKLEDKRPDPLKFTLLKYKCKNENLKLEYSLFNNKLLKLDAETVKTKNVVDYIASRFNGSIYVNERNSCIYYDDKNEIVYNFAVINKSVSGSDTLDKEIFSHPLMAFAITNSDRTREMYLNKIDMGSISVNGSYIFLIDLKAKSLMITKSDSGLYRDIFDSKLRIIKPNTGKFEVLDIEFDSRKLFG